MNIPNSPNIQIIEGKNGKNDDIIIEEEFFSLVILFKWKTANMISNANPPKKNKVEIQKVFNWKTVHSGYQK